MARKIISAKGGLSIMDMFGVGIAKTVSELLLSKVVGNGTVVSGGTKIAGAFIFPKMIGGKMGTILGTALAVDGVEDILQSVMGGNLLGGMGGQGNVI